LGQEGSRGPYPEKKDRKILNAAIQSKTVKKREGGEGNFQIANDQGDSKEH